MAGIYTDFWRIVKPAPAKTQYVPTNPEAAKLYSNFSWYTKVMKGASSRFSKYSQYKNMDNDVFVARALDTIAEEMTQINTRTNLPFEIEYQNESNQGIPESITMTVRAALRHWCDTQDLDTILFDVARTVTKFGDCFFRKTSDFKRWQYVDPSDIIGISINADTGAKEHYHVRVGEKNRQGAFGDIQLVPAAGMVHFSLSSSMGENGPFGESVLFPCIKSFRHLSLLEDSVIIYRVVRAPERRVFFLDVGNMPPQRVKAYLESVRNEMKQKRIPNESGGQEKIDSVYNPMSMLEDYFFAQTCLNPMNSINLLDGRTIFLKDLIDEQNQGKRNYVYSLNAQTHELEPGLVTWAGYTRKDAEQVRVHLDNGEHIDVTPDHRFVMRDGREVEASQLQPNDSLMPLNLSAGFSAAGQTTPRYTRYVCNATGKKKFVHMTMCPKKLDGSVIHHKDFNSFNNEPDNLVEMLRGEHQELHRANSSFSLKSQWDNPEQRSKLQAGMRNCYDNRSVEFDAMLKERNSQNARSLWRGENVSGCLEALEINRKAIGARRQFDVSEALFLRFLAIFNQLPKRTVHQPGILVTLKALNRDKEFMAEYRHVNERRLTGDKECERLARHFGQLDKLCKLGGYRNFGDFKKRYAFNHKVTSVERLTERADMCDITIESPSNSHLFALAAGVYVHNSDGRGSRVETLSGGENLGEIADLNYFQNKFLQGLRIPSSYMRGGNEGGAQINDGKVGIAYIEELRFANYVSRLQSKINSCFEDHFKAYMKSAGLNIDPDLFKLRLCDPQNFKDYRQAEVDDKLISNYNSIKDSKVLSERYKLSYYLGMNEDEIQENEMLIKQERGIPDGGIDETLTELRMIYDPKWDESRPEIKVDDSYDDHTASTAPTGEEAAPADEEEEDPEKGKEAEAGGKEEATPEVAKEPGAEAPKEAPAKEAPAPAEKSETAGALKGI